ncbi:tRNA (guanosine(37)-N1)-methyltransferase TrmD [Ferrovibrio sp.]|uniref:tRNA (guanosine(37)-N1)-methyltransferase TrmD n=1 Tax=Ferrovibrio sp. TaxID=1917215 RepID=UPI0025C21F8C|nr:tRNA (guanosine(37)-N1)-methyltransferase TrmD [Ferrovibrio sp.]MBX3453918.1 tRNA (guanosine(37)-N1)-methyltransferase TrmD [Ferrovibrio sp.]
MPDAAGPNACWQARVLTLYPAMFPGPLGQSLAGRALERGVWALQAVDIRDYARDKHRSVDDTPAGGGPGMVMRADVLAAAVDDAVAALPGKPLIYFSPRGRRMDQGLVRQLADAGGAVMLCGRFEGVDERLLEARPIEQVSLGDFVLSGGEIAALALMDAVVRLLPGVMGEAESAIEESFSAGLLEYPQYTRPMEWEGRSIPEILLSGHHARIADWRRAMAEAITAERRPDLWDAYRRARPSQDRRGRRGKTD